MSEQDKVVPFGEEFWKEQGGDEWVEQIDKVEPALTLFSDRLMNHANIREGEVVLDIGCGGGLTSIELATQVGNQGRVVGVDISPQILAVAQKRGKDIGHLEFLERDAGTADMGEAVFDLVYSRFGVMFFENPIMAFSNIKRSLKPDGRFAVLCWRTLKENPWMSEPAAAVFEIVPPKEKPNAEPDPDAPGPFSLGEADRINHVMEKAGFNNVNLDPVDIGMSMGGIDDALEFLMEMGPAAGALAEASDEQRTAGREAIRRVLEKYDSADDVSLPAAAWIVSASL